MCCHWDVRIRLFRALGGPVSASLWLSWGIVVASHPHNQVHSMLKTHAHSTHTHACTDEHAWTYVYTHPSKRTQFCMFVYLFYFPYSLFLFVFMYSSIFAFLSDAVDLLPFLPSPLQMKQLSTCYVIPTLLISFLAYLSHFYFFSLFSLHLSLLFGHILHMLKMI